MVSFGAVYCLTPWLWRRRGLYSMRLVEWHFWLSTIGILLYITSMWVAGLMQGLMWRAYNDLGFLQYSFVETVVAMHWPFVIRATGGSLYLLGGILMAYNVWRTARGDLTADIALQPRIAAAPELRAPALQPGLAPAE
jgi:cytochrome c oxidase cbb3-type subunit 1